MCLKSLDQLPLVKDLAKYGTEVLKKTCTWMNCWLVDQEKLHNFETAPNQTGELQKKIKQTGSVSCGWMKQN